MSYKSESATPAESNEVSRNIIVKKIRKIIRKKVKATNPYETPRPHSMTLRSSSEKKPRSTPKKVKKIFKVIRVVKTSKFKLVKKCTQSQIVVGKGLGFVQQT